MSATPTIHGRPKPKPGRAWFTAAGLEKLRQAALRNQPWKKTTGPRSARGRAQMVINGKRRQLGERSVREVKADVAELNYLLQHMDTCQKVISQVAYLDIRMQPNTSDANLNTTP